MAEKAGRWTGRRSTADRSESIPLEEFPARRISALDLVVILPKIGVAVVTHYAPPADVGWHFQGKSRYGA